MTTKQCIMKNWCFTIKKHYLYVPFVPTLASKRIGLNNSHYSIIKCLGRFQIVCYAQIRPPTLKFYEYSPYNPS